VVAVWLILTPLVAMFTIYTAFLALCTARAIQAQGVEIPYLVRVVAAFWLVVGYPADILFNWTVGVYTFREWRGWTFSSHIQSRVDRGLWDDKTAMWARFLNAGAPDHIKRLPKE
jgi:hypothetical protein